MDHLRVITSGGIDRRGPIKERGFVVVATQHIINDRQAVHVSWIRRIELECLFEMSDGIIPTSLPPRDGPGKVGDFRAVRQGAISERQFPERPRVIAFPMVINERLRQVRFP